MARLQNSRRPLVVSFKRKNNQIPRRTKQVLFDLDLQEALDNLQQQQCQKNPRYIYNDIDEVFWRSDLKCSGYYNCKINDFNNSNFVTFSNLEPKHICPLNNGGSGFNNRESFFEEVDENLLLKIHTDASNRRSCYKKYEQNRLNNKGIIYERSSLTKSSTMPPVLFHEQNKNRGDLHANVSHSNAKHCLDPTAEEGIWCCNKEYERSNSCSQLELIMENDDKNPATTCCHHNHQHSGSIVIKVP